MKKILTTLFISILFMMPIYVFSTDKVYAENSYRQEDEIKRKDKTQIDIIADSDKEKKTEDVDAVVIKNDEAVTEIDESEHRHSYLTIFYILTGFLVMGLVVILYIRAKKNINRKL